MIAADRVLAAGEEADEGAVVIDLIRSKIVFDAMTHVADLIDAMRKGWDTRDHLLSIIGNEMLASGKKKLVHGEIEATLAPTYEAYCRCHMQPVAYCSVASVPESFVECYMQQCEPRCVVKRRSRQAGVEHA